MSVEFPEDIPIIRSKLEKHNIGLSDAAVAKQWEKFSSGFGASWLEPSKYWLKLFEDWILS